MSRKIPNQPHPTPDPEKTHGAPSRWGPGFGGAPEPGDDPGTVDEGPTYDSVHDDLDKVLSESMESPEPDPNLKPSGHRSATDPEIGTPTDRPGQAPRTSEIFRSVVGHVGVGSASAAPAERPPDLAGSADEHPDVPGIGSLDPLRVDPDPASAADRPGEAPIPWGQIALLSYASVLTLVLIWLLGTGRIPRSVSPSAVAEEAAAPESVHHFAEPVDDTPPPPLPPENLTRVGQPLRVGDVEVTPMSIVAGPVELVRAIAPGARRRERDCLILRLRLANLSKHGTFAPLDRNLVRDRDLRIFDPYISTAGGRSIRLFPLAMESEWSIRGQFFPELAPGESAETSVVAEPGSAGAMAGEMTWRVRLRTGIYRSDLIGIQFDRGQVRRRAFASWDDEE